ncbi:TRAP transporter substrate-binding protein [Ciceribacter ferrooxidans]|uniref:Transporter n=1 Tax=Ciceribacter ferrooxidans TaxID=2509717 RepID=A0A4Q2TRL3_9HYPH|nr:TRAP transporter substrate-binding protein [Ciceribacter ferrooxidans]RYC23252.1 transporter [Ciceribacter ferrooxidans]
MKRLIITATAFSLFASTVLAEVEEGKFKVVGTWGTGAMYPEHEAPLWSKALPDASGGKLTAEIQPMTDLGLKGFETVKLLQTGVYDAGFGAYSYIASGNPVFEGIDLALASGSGEENRRLVEAYEPVVAEAFERIHGVKLLASYPFPAQILVCRGAFNGLADLKGRKIRVYSTTLGDMAEGLGGVSVTIPLGDVVPALQRGVVDCGISSGISMYTAKWQDVVKYVYETPVSAGIAFLAMNKDRWSNLNPETQALIEAEVAKFVDGAWAALADSQIQGVACLTGQGEKCRYGEPAKMQLVKATDADETIRKQLLAEFVLKRYAERCGDECTARWNETAGAVVGVDAKP